MEIHQLEQFKAIAESRTMREAADKLFISQPALSQNLKKLEAELGCTLFDRSHNQISITPYGEILLAHAHRILFDLKEVSAEIDALKQQDAQTIHIDSFYLPLSLFVLPQVANTFPDLRFDASIVTSTVLAKRVIDGITDIAFLPRQFCPAHLAFRTIQEERLLLSLSPASPLVGRESIADEDLGQTSLLLPEGLAGLSPWYEEVVSHAGVSEALVERMPTKAYLELMDRTERAHFTTSMMVLFSGSGTNRPALPVEGEMSKRELCVAYRGDNEKALPVVEHIVSRGSELVINHAFLPYLLAQDGASNLSLKLDI